MSLDLKTQKRIGALLIGIGILGFLFAVIASGLPYSYFNDNGSVPSASIFFVMIGMAFYFPDLLQGPCGGFSTMRMVVFMVVIVFVVLTIKIGWSTHSFDEFRIDSTWVYILGLAFGSKLFQQMSEQQGENLNRKDTVVKEEEEKPGGQ
jgi:hypothetical protein